MTVAELIYLLEDQDPNAQVIIGHQPNYPLGARIAGVATTKDLDEDDQPRGFDGVIIAADASDLYLTRAVWEALYV